MATKPDNLTKPYILTPQQMAVVDLLAGGSTLTSAAAAVKVSRQTVSEWLNHNASFQAELNTRRHEAFAEHQERLRSLVPKALDILVSEGLEGCSPKLRVATAVTVLRAAGLYGLSAPGGSTDPVEIEAEAGLHRTQVMLKSLC